jgi:hypothetical protein
MKLAKVKHTVAKISDEAEEAKEATQDTQPKYADLKSVMNYTVPFELIYSGVENESYYDILYDMGIRNFLMSYHYIQNKHIKMNERFTGKSVRLFIDSGAHTYQNDPKYLDYDVDYWEKHLQSYLRWVEKYKDFIFAIASFDFENVVGPEIVDRWNREYFEPFMLRTGIPVCFVWHQNSYQSWEFYCKRYPYVGFSSVNTEGVAIDLAEYKDKLRTAEKYDSLVHGFGMTRTSMLTELPFYTSDSTTWLVGLQYGEINYWRDTKMSRLKKDAWKGQYLSEICSRYGLDSELLLAEDVTEMIRANVGAFMDAEKFIQTRLLSSMYWMKSKAKKNNVADPTIYPSPEYLGGKEPLLPYAEKLNVNPEAPEAEDLLFYVTVLLNWDNPDYEVFKDNVLNDEKVKAGITEYHDRFINRIVPDDETKVQDLIEFFTLCVSGENDTLLQLGTNFDREVKERDNYVEDEPEYDEVDLSPEEVKVRLAQCLPAPEDGSTQEIEGLDEEIYKEADIVPTWGKDGKLLKGQVKVRKPKQVYSSKYPKFSCDTCYAAQRCKEFRPGYVCAFQKMFGRFDTRNQSDIIASIQGIVNHNMVRMQRAMIMETMNGTIDPVVSQLMDTNVRYMNMLNQLYENSNAEVLRQSRIVRADGTVEENTQLQNPRGGGIMEKLFSSLAVSKDTAETTEEPPIEAEGSEVPDVAEHKKNPRYEDPDKFE